MLLAAIINKFLAQVRQILVWRKTRPMLSQSHRRAF